MSCYFIAQILIHDSEEYQKYICGVDEVFSKFNGKYLALDDDPVVLEGKWAYGRIVIIEFPDETELKQWYESEEYQGILKLRLNAAKCDTLMVKGLELGTNNMDGV